MKYVIAINEQRHPTQYDVECGYPKVLHHTVHVVEGSTSFEVELQPVYPERPNTRNTTRLTIVFQIIP